MPLYEYECDSCAHRFEVIQKFSDPPIDKCPKCGSTVRKLMSSPAIQFKGSGWYITDYAKKDSKAAAKAGAAKDGAAKDGSSAPESSTTKSDTTSTTTPAGPATTKSE
jgi:putative FmdB family regulatory protein